MLTFEEKIAVIESNFPQLKRSNVSLGRVNFKYEESFIDKKNVVYHLHPNGNGYVYTAKLLEFESDPQGFTNIRDLSEVELKNIVKKSIQSLTYEPDVEEDEVYEEIWINENNQELVMVEENDQYNVYAGDKLDGTFNSYGEAAQYLDEEGFMPKEI